MNNNYTQFFSGDNSEYESEEIKLENCELNQQQERYCNFAFVYLEIF